MPYLSSNIPYNIFYNTILSEILRIARCSLLYRDFLVRAKGLCERMRRQGADVIFGKKALLRFIRKHSITFRMTAMIIIFSEFIGSLNISQLFDLPDKYWLSNVAIFLTSCFFWLNFWSLGYFSDCFHWRVLFLLFVILI